MTKKDVIKWFGSEKAVADALGLWPQAVYKWPEQIPKLRQFQIERLTKGELKADEV